MHKFSAEKAADELLRAHASGATFTGFETDGPTTEDEGYEAQRRFLDALLAAEHDTYAGHKIGATTMVMQEYLQIRNPCAGRLRTSRLIRSGALLPAYDRGRLGVECELAVRLGSDLPSRDQPYRRDEISEAVGTCAAAIEVVEDRYADWRALDAATLIADNFFHYAIVLGAEHHDIDPNSLDRVRASMTIDSRLVGSGVGSDVLGHPMNALTWIANSASARGIGLRRDEVVLLGSLVETHWVDRGATVSVENDLLGPVRVGFQ